jgi:transmembrane sensor
MKDINFYTTEDFVQDLNFRKWVLGKLPQKDTFWEDWLADNPQKASMVEEAKTLVVATRINEMEHYNHENTEGIANIMSQIKPINKWLKYRKIVAIAATVVLVLGVFLKYSGSLNTPFNKQISNNETENKSPSTLVMTLSDGTVVTLKKDSKLQVSEDFGGQFRTVTLSGEAFFEVKKDPEHPFLVIAGGVVTKVLGTSFTVRAYQGETKTSVAVKTGKVTVYQEKSMKQSNHPDQILLTPNQQAIFEKGNGKMVKTLVEKPMLLNKKEELLKFDYNETPIITVLSQLEDAYGVKMVFDAELLANCNLTAAFGNEPLYDKIDIICETIQAKYEIADGQIVIYARGCK